MHEKINYKEIIGLSLPIVGLSLIAFGAFSPKLREWWLKVSGYKCQYEFYDEKRGWQQCNKPANHVHHITPEGWTRDHGGDPDHNVGMGLCQNHHVRNFNDEEYSYDSSFHPDVAQAYKNYHEWKMQTQHMQSITGRKESPRNSPFDEVVAEHRRKSKLNQRYWAGTPEMDEYYEEKMRNLATKHIAQTGEKKPVIKKKHGKT